MNGVGNYPCAAEALDGQEGPTERPIDCNKCLFLRNRITKVGLDADGIIIFEFGSCPDISEQDSSMQVVFSHATQKA